MVTGFLLITASIDADIAATTARLQQLMISLLFFLMPDMAFAGMTIAALCC